MKEITSKEYTKREYMKEEVKIKPKLHKARTWRESLARLQVKGNLLDKSATEALIKSLLESQYLEMEAGYSSAVKIIAKVHIEEMRALKILLVVSTSVIAILGFLIIILSNRG